MSSKQVKERIFFRVQKGSLVPADSYAQERLRARKYHVNDVVAVTISKLRNPAFNRLAHRIGQLVVANIDDFSGMDAHQALKRLQLESNAGCDEIMIDMPDVGKCLYRMPKSLSFESVDEGEFHEIVAKICRWISERYYQGMNEDRIIAMAECMIDE